MGVGTANVEEIIRTVLKKLANMECDRLPKPTFSKYMLLEACALSQIQVADTVLKDWDTAHNTLSSDGTSKYNKSYITYDITGKDGIDLCLGVRETGNGTAEEQLKVLTEVLDDIVDISGYKDEGSSKIVKSIKNVLSDRCITQKKFNALFKEYRSDVPNVVKDWSSLSDNDKENVTDVNDFFVDFITWLV